MKKTQTTDLVTDNLIFYYSVKFFPPTEQSQIVILLDFVITAHSLAKNKNKKNLIKMHKDYHLTLDDKKISDKIVKKFARLAKKLEINPDWIEAFFTSLKQDMTKKTYYSLEETIGYMYGSSEVVSMMFAHILRLSIEIDFHVRLMARTIHYISFIRDLKETNQLKKQYLPLDEMKHFGLINLEENYIIDHPEKFVQFIKFQIETIRDWQIQAESGFSFIPWKYRIAVMTTWDLHLWVLKQIERDPMIVFTRKIEPGKARVIFTGLKNIFLAGFVK